MRSEPYQLRYLPLFEQDLIETVDYIANVLQNESAAERLVGMGRSGGVGPHN